MDLAVDEQGLWVLCGNTKSGYGLELRAGKIDVVRNIIPRYFDLTGTGEYMFLMKHCCDTA